LSGFAVWDGRLFSKQFQIFILPFARCRFIVRPRCFPFIAIVQLLVRQKPEQDEENPIILSLFSVFIDFLPYYP
jgi:hypothetical protein